MGNHIKLEIDGNVEIECDVEAVVLNRSFGTNLVATLTFAEAPAAQRAAKGGAGLMSSIVGAVANGGGLQNKAAELKATAQASADAAREKAATDELAANPTRGRDPEA